MFSSSRVLFQRAGNGKVAATVAAGAVAAYGLISWHEYDAMQNKSFCAVPQKRLLIVGGGTAGIGVAAMCEREGIQKVTMVEPKPYHWYQPLWTLVGGGIKSNKDSVRPMKDILPRSTEWIQDAVESFDPDNNKVRLQNGSTLDYDYLIVCAGMQSNWDAVPGMKQGLDTPESGVVSVYHYDYSDKVWKEFNRICKDFKDKTMVFTMPATPIKCAGAPQKIMWLLEDTLREAGLRGTASIEFWVPGGAMFGVKHYSDKLEKIRQERGVDAHFKHELVKIDVDQKIATFKDLGNNNQLVQKAYDFLHVVPPMSPPDFIRESKLANAAGWLEVDQYTMQSPRYPNVFALGDCCSTPNSKTAAAITSQAPVLVHNLAKAMSGEKLDGKYDGYASCPLILGQKRVMLAEFGYGGKLMGTFARETGPFPLKYVGEDGAMQQRFFYFLKEQLFPFVYWNLWTRGWWYGTKGPFKPNVVPKEE